MLGRDVGDAAHELLVLALGVVDDDDVGRGHRASSAVSPRWFMPSSMIAARCVSRRQSSVSGSPIALLKLPWVESTRSAPKCAESAAAVMSFTVVLPLLPTTRASGSVKRARQLRRVGRARKRIVDDDQVPLQRRCARIGHEGAHGAAPIACAT